MSGDGAYLGVTADRALDTILGGKEQPGEDEMMTVEQEREWLLSAPPAQANMVVASYGECARIVAGEILRFALANPDLYASTPAETEPAKGPDGTVDWSDPHKYGPPILGLYDVLKNAGVPLSDLGITGFQWGWAYNAAARCLGAPESPNPAIVTIGE